MNDFEKLSEVDMNQIVNDLSEIVNPRAFISSDNLHKLSYLSHTKKAELYNTANGRPDFGDICLYKAAYNIGKSRFQKEAEYLMIRKGIKEYRRLQKESGFATNLAAGIKSMGNIFASNRTAKKGLWDSMSGAVQGTKLMNPEAYKAVRNTAIGAAGVGAGAFAAGHLSNRPKIRQ